MRTVSPSHPTPDRPALALSRPLPAFILAALLVVAAACGGGDGGTGPVTVAQVVISAPAAPPTLGALGRTVQFAAQARDGSGALIAGASITWSSTNTAVATVSTSGLVTAVANGTTQVKASADGVQSSPVTVTVAQVPASVAITPASVAFGAIGSTRQLAATVQDSTANAIAGQAIAWSQSGPGTTATVSAAGLVTAVAVGALDTALATAGSLFAKAPISVAQVVASVSVTSTSATPDTLKTTGRTRQFSAAARDSNANAVGTAVFTWSTNAASVATVSAAGLVTAVADGSATITATAGSIPGTRAVVVRRYASTFTLAPTSGSITSSGATLGFTGSAQDSNATALTIGWVSRTTTVLTVSPATGTSTTATAVGNGTSYLVMSAGTRSDSALVTVSGQTATVSFASAIQPILTANCTGCHNGSPPGSLPGSLDLRSATAYNALVNQTSVEMPPLLRVKPGDVTNSYLARKIDPSVGTITDSRMPLGGVLQASDIQLIKTWILQGAANN